MEKGLIQGICKECKDSPKIGVIETANGDYVCFKCTTDNVVKVLVRVKDESQLLSMLLKIDMITATETDEESKRYYRKTRISILKGLETLSREDTEEIKDGKVH